MTWHHLDTLLTRIRPHRESLALVIDALMIAACWNITYLFRLGFERWQNARPDYDGWVLIGVIAVYLSVFVLLKVPKGMWRFSGFGEIQRLTIACGIAGMVTAVGVLMAQLVQVPRAVLGLHPVISLMGLAMVRIGYRMLYEHMRGRISGSMHETRRALVMGAGDAAKLLIAGIQHHGWVVVGLLDDDARKHGARIGNVPVLGPLDSAARWAEVHGITHVIVAMPSAAPERRRRALDLAAATGLPVVTVPTAAELHDGQAVAQVREIEPEDLLGRAPVQLDEGGISECLSGKVVLITGAGGSIGSELCRQVARYGPRRLVLYELSEFALYRIEQELTEAFPHIPLVRLVGDVRDPEHLRVTFAQARPQVVFHAAAYKHVPLMEDDNAFAAVRNNTLGTWRAASAAAAAGAERFVLISTDKAVNPTNVMGATKRAAEMVISQLAAQVAAAGGRTRFMAVRFGNVLGSSGSVIPKFKAQIARGGPVTVTHPDITRFFMTIPEAARLVVQAAAIGEGGQVFVLDMGEPVRIVDLARDLIRLSGHTLAEIPIAFSGLRPGEKLYEELLADADATLPTRFERLRIARLDDRGQDVQTLLDWAAARSTAPDDEVRERLAQLVGEYRPARPAGPLTPDR
ncbi:polysaccharide biosynthesis protein [Sphaerotilus montanus]|uniref:FlaA1/EpsC-like NDP-sugar epimerase n=1 Tax=Sphaerotilus montanus TaxID=522889 RepID=A0A7Y9QVQ7_9BURK|nr:nucleoside-diphosphate sugar epimerase/dehydratase [Sphaerotilus montanus]NYG32335.1 FlaA1/EpsC-like NDP-sugar epimerase [Sphaerotilus montanus]NZD56167.1 polysaccharide biosynthesis protein [Sphaerotilus montanus]